MMHLAVCFFAGTVKVKSANIQVGDLIIVEKVSGASQLVRLLCVCMRMCENGTSLPPLHKS